MLSHKESSYGLQKKAAKREDIPLPAMQIEIIDPATHKVVSNIACKPGTTVFSLLDKERLVYIYENRQGELALKCVKY